MVQRCVQPSTIVHVAPLRVVYPLLGLHYVLSFVHGLSRQNEWAAYLGLELLLGIVSLAGGWALWNRDIEEQFYPGVTKLFCTMIVLHAGLRLASGGGGAHLSPLVLVLIGGVWLLPKWKEWFCYLALPILLIWIGIPAIRLPQWDQRGGTIELTLATIVIGAMLWVRNSSAHPEVSLVAEESETEQARKQMLVAADGSNDGFWYWSISTGQFTVNAAWARLLAYKPDEITDDIEEWWSRVHPGYLEQLQADVDAHLKGGGSMFSNEHRILRKDGTYLWVSARGNAVRNEIGRAIALAGSLRDMTSVIDADRNSRHDSFHDKLTGLPNRGFLMARLNQLTARQTSATHPTALFALLFLDLDRFKIINDSLGHLAGDQLLLHVADRLRNCVRPMDMVSRFAGDEFAVLLEHVTDTDEALRIALRIRDALGHPYDLSGRDVLSGASVGVVMGHDRSATADELLHMADTAMYHVKTKQRGQVQLFDASMQAANSRVLDLKNGLTRALGEGQMLVHYQPVVALATGQITGVEALVRWQRTAEELISPTEFVKLAEDLGIMGEIGEWVLRTACAQNVDWIRQGLAPTLMSVHLSPRQLQNPHFADLVAEILRQTGMSPQRLELELKESTMLQALERTPQVLANLAGQGIRFSIDDFGAGLSSLSHLRKFTFHTLKLDRMFVADLTTDIRSRAVANGLITLAHDLQLQVVAEGVERREQLQLLAELQCDQVQGFLISRPLPANLLVAGLRAVHLPRVVEWSHPPASDVRNLGQTLRDQRLAEPTSNTPCAQPSDVI